MASTIQYIYDETGKKTSVIISMKKWENLQQQLKKQSVLLGIKEAMIEVKEARKKGTSLQSLNDFIDECRSQNL